MKNNLKIMFLFLVLAIFVVGCGKEEVVEEEKPVVVEPTTPSNVMTVCQDGSCDYNTIASAVAAASSGNEVRITDKGTYLEEEVIFEEGKSGITIDCKGATMDGTGLGTAFYLKEVTDITIQNCVMQNYAQAVSIDNADGNKILDNQMLDSGRGVYGKGANDNEIKNNKMLRNKLGMELYVCERTLIEGNTISESVATGITDANSQTGNKLVNNVISNNGRMGIWIKSENMILTGNQITNNIQMGLLCGAKTVTMSGNTCSDNEGDQCKGCPVDSCTELGC